VLWVWPLAAGLCCILGQNTFNYLNSCASLYPGTQAYKRVPSNLMLRIILWWASHPEGCKCRQVFGHLWETWYPEIFSIISRPNLSCQAANKLQSDEQNKWVSSFSACSPSSLSDYPNGFLCITRVAPMLISLLPYLKIILQNISSLEDEKVHCKQPNNLFCS